MTSLRGVAVVVVLLASDVVYAQWTLEGLCNNDLLDSTQAEARVVWARRCSLQNNVQRQANGALMTFESGVVAADGALLHDYLEVSPLASGGNTYSGDSGEVNQAFIDQLYLAGSTSQSIDANGAWLWTRDPARKKQQLSYPIFGSLSDVYAVGFAPLYPNPSLRTCPLFQDKQGSKSVGEFFLVGYCPAARVAPSNLKYGTNPVAYVRTYPTPSNIPTSTGGSVLSYSASPALPSGLTLDPVTGVISGTPTSPAGTTSHTITATNASGSASTTLTITINAAPVVSGGPVAAIALGPDGTTYLGGYFTQVGGVSRNHLAAIDSTGAVTGWNPNANSNVRSLTVSGNTIYVGGNFTALGASSRAHVGSVDLNGNVTAWDPSAVYDVTAIAVYGGLVYVGGWFNSIGGVPRNGLASIDGLGKVTTWNPISNSGIANALGISGSTLYVGGSFASIGGISRKNLAAFDLTSAAVTAWDPGTNGTVDAISVSGSTIFVGGSFTTVGAKTRNRIAAIDSSGAVTSWDPNASGEVLAVAVGGATVYAGGYFGSIGNKSNMYVAALDSAGGVTSGVPALDYFVRALVVSPNAVLVGGSFATVDGAPTGYFVRVPK